MSKNGRPGQTCREEGCGAPLDAYQCRGYCLKHYRIRRLAGEFGFRPCRIVDCGNHAVGAGLCELHRNRIRRTGGVDVDHRPKVGSAASSWRGGRSVNGNGYVLITLPPDHPRFAWGKAPSAASGRVSRQILEHRLVMSEALGRELEKQETVHHLNGDRTDNRLENLQLRQGAHGPGIVVVCAECGSKDVTVRPL